MKFTKFGLSNKFSTAGKNTSTDVEFAGEAVLILHQDPTKVEGRKEYRFELSEQACKDLGITPGKTPVVFNDEYMFEGKIFLLNATGLPNVAGAKRLYKNRCWSDKGTHVFLNKILPWVDTSEDRQVIALELVENEDHIKAALLKPYEEEKPSASADNTEEPVEEPQVEDDGW